MQVKIASKGGPDGYVAIRGMVIPAPPQRQFEWCVHRITERKQEGAVAVLESSICNTR